MKLGNNVKRHRFEKNDMSQEELANEIGVSRQSIHSIEKGKFVPSTLFALKLAKYLISLLKKYSILLNNS